MIHNGTRSGIRCTLLAWALAHLCVWSLIPAICNTCLPLDSIEASMWGSEWAWGYDKHPPLSGWTARAAATLFGDLGIYLFAQLCVVTAGMGIYRLARVLGLDRQVSLLSVLALDLLFFYSYGAVEYNVNVLQMPFWAWGWYFGIHAVEKRKLSSWVGLGVCVAFGALTKYLAVFLLAPLSIAWFQRAQLKQVLTTAGIYLAGLTSILLFLPHLLWMQQHDWITITYGLSRGGSEEAVWWNHLSYPMEFFAAQVGILAPLLITALLYRRKTGYTPFVPKGLIGIAFGAYTFTLVISMLFRISPVTMWAAPMPLACGIWLAGRFTITSKPRLFYRAITCMTLFYAVAYFIVFGLAPMLRTKPHRVNYPGREIALQAEQQWAALSDASFDYIIADEWMGGIVNHYGSSAPSVVIHGDFKLSPFLSEKEVRHKGALVLWLKSHDHLAEEQKPLQREFLDLDTLFDTIQSLPDLIIPWPRRLDDRAGRYGVAYIPPEVL